jgi:hypothetical protein
MGSHEEVKKFAKDWFIGLAAGFSIQKLLTGYDRHLTLLGNCVEKLFRVRNDVKYFF